MASEDTRIFPHWPLSEPDCEPPAKTAWAMDAPIAFVGAWEPPEFRRRAGYAWNDEADYLECEFGVEAMKDIRRLGCSHLVLYFAKGFGPSASNRSIDGFRQSAQRARKEGLRIGAYIQVSTVAAEILKADYPEVDAWLARDGEGRIHHYHFQQPFRQVVCHSHPGAVAYLEKQVEYAVHELGADLLHFDGFQLTQQPHMACHCDRCQASYRRWLNTQYPDPDSRNLFFGVVDFNRIQMPPFPVGGAFPDVIVSPDLQAFFRFQWDRQLAFLKHLRRYVLKLGKQIAVTINPLLSNARNQNLFWCQWAERLLPWVDAAWCEDPFHFKWREERLIARSGTLKLAAERQTPVCCYHWTADPVEMEASLAFTAALNGGNTACLGFTHRFLPHYTLAKEVKEVYGKWLVENHRIFQDTLPDGEIALLRHQRSLAWNSRHPWAAMHAMEQLLMAMRMPWRMIDALEKSALKGIRTLVAPHVESLSDDEIQFLEKWVRAGGRLWISARTGTHDENRARRPQRPILDWSEATRPLNAGIRAADWKAWLDEDYVEIEGHGGGGDAGDARIVTVGDGTLCYCPRLVIHDSGNTTNQPIPAEALRKPENAPEVMESLQTLHGPMELECEAPPSLVLHTTRRQNIRHIHLVEADPTRSESEVMLRFARPQVLEHCEIHSPRRAQMADSDPAAGVLRIRFERYAVLLVNVAGETASV